MKLSEVQADVIQKYGITINEHSTCRCRMHAHIKTRTVCKWHPTNSLKATFDLMHEIGHIETTKGDMRRCEAEYYATAWAIERFKEYGLEVREEDRARYQRYILMERDRGIRRHGHGLPTAEELKLPE